MQEERDSFNDQLAALASTSNSNMLSFIHSFTSSYPISQNQPPTPPLPPQPQLKAPEGIVLYETSPSSDEREDKDIDQEDYASACDGSDTAEPASAQS